MLCKEVNIIDIPCVIGNKNFWLFNMLEHKFYICCFPESGSDPKYTCVC